jgi:hypothetical protein
MCHAAEFVHRHGEGEVVLVVLIAWALVRLIVRNRT